LDGFLPLRSIVPTFFAKLFQLDDPATGLESPLSVGASRAVLNTAPRCAGAPRDFALIGKHGLRGFQFSCGPHSRLPFPLFRE